MLDIILQRVRDHSPHLLEPEGRLPEAAVLMPITRSEDPELVLTLRASGLSTHGGEVAFPGGRRDPEDRDLVHTALREAEEEVGLAPGMVEIVGPLKPGVTLTGRTAGYAERVGMTEIDVSLTHSHTRAGASCVVRLES